MVRDGDDRRVINSSALLFSSSHTAYVKSQTLGGDGMHTQGVVLGEIVKANIPVRNGVVHLIHRPLVIVDTTVVQFLEVRKASEAEETLSCGCVAIAAVTSRACRGSSSSWACCGNRRRCRSE